MILFPIHLLELTTLALIFLFIYKIVKALSLETNQHKQSMPECAAKLGNNQQRLDQTKATQKTSTQDKSIKKTEPSTTYQPSSSPEASPATANQSVLNNYIGDFF